ncbi:MAG: thiol reductant ABC exporter subunit CydC [Lysinibacillus sp.]
MKKLLTMIWEDKKDVLLAMTAGTISGLTAVALFAQSGLLISKAALMPPFYIILILTAFLKLFGVTKSISKYAERLLSHRVTFRFMSAVRLHFFKRLLPHANLLNTYKSGDLLNRITTDVEVLQNFFLRVIYPPFIAFFVFMATILFTLWFSPWLALLLMVGFILTSTVVPYMLYALREKSSSVEKNSFTNEATEYFYGYLDLQLHHQLEEKEQSLQTWGSRYARATRKELDRAQTARFWNQFISLMTAFFIVGTGAYLTSTNNLDGLYLAMLILVALTVFESAVPLAMMPTYARQTKAAVDRLEEITPSTQSTGAIVLPEKPPSIKCRAISYTYSAMARPALLDVSLNIAPGEKVAIVGPSGCGKSTLLQLMMREFLPTSGELAIADHPISSIAEHSLHERMGVLLQHNHFFSGTIRENLQLAKSAATDEEMQQALAKAALSKSLDDTVFEKGGNLSGGEKQRLAFARLLLKQGTFWLLDEPFTSLDVKTENRLFETLLAEADGKTLVLITHNLTGLDKMDRIYVMDSGRIIESGTYRQLLQKRGLFYKMHQQQIGDA